MFGRENRKSFFFHLFSQISILLVCFILAGAYSLYFKITNESFATINQFNEKIISQASYNFNYMDNFIRSYIVNLYNDSRIKQLMYANSLIKIDSTLINTLEELDTQRKGAPFIHSVYIYNSTVKQYIVLGKNNVIRSNMEMFDTQVNGIIAQTDANLLRHPIAREIPDSVYTVGKSSKVYTYLFSETSSRTDRDTIVINVDADWVMQNLYAMYKDQTEKNSFFLMVNKEGEVYGDSNGKQFLMQMNDEPYVNKVLNSKRDVGHFQTTIASLPAIVTYSKMADLDLTFISVTPFEQFFKYKANIRNFTIVLASIILIIGMAAAYYMSRRMHTPIKALEKKVRILLEDSGSGPRVKNEIAFISNALSNVSAHMGKLRAFKVNHILILKNEYLRKLLLDEAIGDSGMRKMQLELYETNLSEEQLFYLILFRVDRFAHFLQTYTYEEIEQLAQDFRLQIIRHFSHNYQFEIVNMKNDQFVMIMNQTAPLEGTGLHDLIESIRLFRQNVASVFPQTVSVTISKEISDLGEIGGFYMETCELSEARLLLGHEAILHAAMIREWPVSDYKFPDSDLNKLLRSMVDDLDLQTAYQIYLSIIQQLSECSVPNIRFGISYLFLMIMEKLKSVENTSHVEFEFNFTQMNQQVNETETIMEINLFFYSFFEKSIEKIIEHKEGRDDELIVKIKDFIARNYRDPNLSINSISDTLHFSTDYLRKMYKKFAGISLSAEINQVRLDQAAKQLIESRNTIEEVLADIGWENHKYFYTLFKAKFGMTPAEFRLNKRLEQMTSQGKK